MNARSRSAALLLSLAALCALPNAAGAEVAPSAAWKIVAATGPTNLPPTQSEVQRLTVSAEGGTFSLTRKAAEGEGTPVAVLSGLGVSVSEGSATASILAGSFEVGERITATTAIAPDTTVLSCTPNCNAGSTMELSNPAEATNTHLPVKAYRPQMSGVSAKAGALHPGDLLSGEGLAPETFVTAVEEGGAKLKLSKPTTSAYEYKAGAIPFTATETTEPPLPYDATAQQLQEALAELPSAQPGTYTVTGGPGGAEATPYYIAFGADLAEQDVEQLSADAESLTGPHHYAQVFTPVPGGAGTGELGIFAANVGSAAAPPGATVHLGPLPAGVEISGAVKGTGWECSSTTSELSCTATGSTGALSLAQQILAPLKVTATAPFQASTEVRIEGPGADSFALPIVVSSQDAAPGAAAFWSGAFEADGSPATQAGSHPASYITYYVLNNDRASSGQLTPAGLAKDIYVDVPPGFAGNPMVAPRCPQSSVACGRIGGKDTRVGTLGVRTGFGSEGVNIVSGFNDDIPAYGYAAQFTTKVVAPIQALLASVRSESDFGVRVFAPHAASDFEKLFKAFSVLEGFPAGAEGRPFLTLQSDCAEEARAPRAVRSRFDTWQEPGSFIEVETPQPQVTGCEKLDFRAKDPSTGEGQVGFSFQPTSTQGSAPVGATAHLQIDQSGLTDPESLATPPLKKAVVKLPAGLSLNPAQANGLQACSEQQIGLKTTEGELPNPIRFDNSPASCPQGSKLGTVEATSPLLEEPIGGTIYLAKESENPFHSLLAIYLAIESPRFGLTIKLAGKIEADPNTGRLTTTFNYNPQVPVEDLELNFRGGGPRSELATPEVCGKHTTTGEWEPWSAPESGPAAKTFDSFEVSGDCSSSLATRPFAPSFEAGTATPIAGAYSPLAIRVKRNDGEGELRRLDFTLPGGLLGRLAGVPYCPEADIAAAAAKTGKEEQASPSCPAASKLGTVDAAAGVGPEPFHAGGTIYLSGPYKGAPLSAVVIAPAVAGPFDLGNVVIRNPLDVNPKTAQITAKSDPIPTILQGIPLKLREVTISVDRPGFTLNPTSCEASQVTAQIRSSDGATATPSNRFQVGNCAALAFKPKLYTRLYGGIHRGDFPRFRAVYVPRKGKEANLRNLTLRFPRSEFIEQGHFRTICTRVQYSAGGGMGERCPKGSVYGHVKAITPLLDEPVEGPVFLRSSNHNLPDVVFALHGQVDAEASVRIDSVKGGLRARVEEAPDVPLSKVILNMQGAQKGLFVNSRNICAHVNRASAYAVAHNGRTERSRPVLNNSKCRAYRKKLRKRHGQHKRRHRHRSG